MSDDEERVLVCFRVSDLIPELPSDVVVCQQCGENVWRALSSPSADKVLCTRCLEIDPDDQIAPPTEGQVADIIRWRQRVRRKH